MKSRKSVGFYRKRRREKSPFAKLVEEKEKKPSGFFTDEEGTVHPFFVSAKTERYKGPEISSASTPKLHPAKREQRRILADRISGKGTVLEVYAGKGELTKAVYAPKADKIVMVDKNPKYLKEADDKLKGKVKREMVVADNVAWLKEAMNPTELGNLKLVDFDAYGSPAETVKAFFDNYPIRKSLLVGLTDGSQIFLGYRQTAEGRRWLRENYGVDVLPGHFGKREDQIRILNEFMEAQGRKHGFRVQPISVAHGVHAIYAGYKIKPRTRV